MAFAIQVLAGRFAFLLPHFLLLLPDPAELGDGKHTDGVDTHPLRSRDPDAPRRRVNAEMDILDVLQNHIDGDVAEAEAGQLSIPSAL